MASLGGSWLAVVCGFGGMRDHGGKLSFRPRIPKALERLAFNMAWRGSHLRVEVNLETATYTVDGRPIALSHHGEPLVVREGSPVTRVIPKTRARPNPGQPSGRAPAPRRPRVIRER